MAGADDDDIDDMLRIEEDIDNEQQNEPPIEEEHEAVPGEEEASSAESSSEVPAKRGRSLQRKRKRAVESSESPSPSVKRGIKTTRRPKSKYVDDAASASDDEDDEDEDEDDDAASKDSFVVNTDDEEDVGEDTSEAGPRPRGVFSDESSIGNDEEKTDDEDDEIEVENGEPGDDEEKSDDENDEDDEIEVENGESGDGKGKSDDEDDEDEEVEFPEIEDVPDDVYNDTRNSNNMSRAFKVLESIKVEHTADHDGYTYCFLSEAEVFILDLPVIFAMHLTPLSIQGPMLSSMAKKQILMLLHVTNWPIHQKHIVETKILKPHFCPVDKTLEKLILSVPRDPLGGAEVIMQYPI